MTAAEQLREELAEALKDAPNRTDYEHYINECASQAIQEEEEDLSLLYELIEQVQDL